MPSVCEGCGVVPVAPIGGCDSPQPASNAAAQRLSPKVAEADVVLAISEEQPKERITLQLRRARLTAELFGRSYCVCEIFLIGLPPAGYRYMRIP